MLPLDGRGHATIERFKPECKLSRSSEKRTGLKDSVLGDAPLFGTASDKWRKELRQYTHVFVVRSGNGNELDWMRELVLKSSLETTVADLSLLTQFFLPGIGDTSLQGLYRSVLGKELECNDSLMEQTLWLGEALLRKMAEMFSRKDTTFHLHLMDLLRTTRDSSDLDSVFCLMQTCNSSGWLDEELLIKPNKLHDEFSVEGVPGRELMPELIPSHTASFDNNVTPDRTIHKVDPVIASKFFQLKFMKEAIPRYEARDEQREFSEIVASQLNEEGHSYIEAPTGIGKTLGYLVPTAFYLEKNRSHKVIIATATKNLQTQILEHDWPVIEKRFPDVKVALLKGKSNYICPTALARQFTHCFDLVSTWEERASWLYLAIFTYETEGDLEKIPYTLKKWLPSLGDLLKDVSAELHCTPSLCSPPDCVYGQHLAEAIKAALIVTNHHKVAFIPQELLAPAHMLIVDEADRFGDNVRQAMSNRITSWDVSRVIHRLNGSSRRRGYLQVLQESIVKKYSRKENKQEVIGIIDSVIANVHELGEAFDEFIRLITPANKHIPPLMVNLPVFRNENSSLIDMLAPVSHHLYKIENGLENLQDEDFSLTNHQKERCESYRILVKELSSLLKEFQNGFGTAGYAHSFNTSENGWILTKTPVYIQHSLEKGIYDEIERVFFTSATLYVSDSASHFIVEYGSNLNSREPKYDRLPSPFPYKENVYCAVDTSVPPYNYRDGKSMDVYRQAVDKAIMAYGLATNGRTLVLFMSHLEMKQTFDRISPFFRSFDILPILQNGSSLEEIREFQNNEYSILFGVDRFWSGVDFPGPTLSQVIIVKAPNPSLNDTLIAHRRLWEQNFMQQFYPTYAKLRLRQGFGRLVRSMKDNGGVIILDSRYEGNYHFQSHLLNLPVPVTFSSNQEIIMRNILSYARLKTEFKERRIDPFLEVINYLSRMEESSSFDIQGRFSRISGMSVSKLGKKLAKV